MDERLRCATMVVSRETAKSFTTPDEAVRAPRRQPDRLDATCTENVNELTSEQGSALVEHVTAVSKEPVEAIDKIPSDLLHPSTVRLAHDATDLDTASL